MDSSCLLLLLRWNGSFSIRGFIYKQLQNKGFIYKLLNCFGTEKKYNLVQAMAPSEFPQDLIIEILKCLPVKSVVRFKCLCKSLCAVINSPDFVNSHLCKCSENINRRKVVFQYMKKKKSDPTRFYIRDLNSGTEEVLELKKSSLRLSDDCVFGCCNGLLLLYSVSRLTALWNPSCRKCRFIPDCPILKIRTESYKMIGLGLGYDDDDDDDYKVVFIFRMSTDETPQVWIFGMRSNIWTRIQDLQYSSSYMRVINVGQFADGCLYWMSHTCLEGRADPHILAFDVRKETFSLLSWPVYPPTRVFTAVLHVLEGRLCFSMTHRCDRDTDLYIRNNVKDGWEHLCSVQEPVDTCASFYGQIVVLGYSKNTNRILLNYKFNKLVAYDVEEKSFENVKIRRHLDCLTCYPTLYTESLVWN